MGVAFTVNSKESLASAHKWLDENFETFKYSKYNVRNGEDRSIDQNALFHVWCTEYAAHLLNKDKKQINPGELNGMKRTIKKRFYNEHGYSWMIETLVDPFSGYKKKDFTSSASWLWNEMFEVLTWVQIKAMGDGLVLESKGRFKTLQAEQNAA